MQRLSLILSTLALVVALTGVGLVQAGVIVTSKQIKNGTIQSQDIHAGGVQSSDVKNGSIDTPDIGANQVTPRDVNMPAPVAVTPPEATGQVSDEYALLTTVATVTKQQAESSLEVTWTGAVASGPGTNCKFQLRANGSAPQAGGGEVFALNLPVNIGTTAVFPGLPAGPVSIEIWAMSSGGIASAPECVVGPTPPGIETTIVAVEQVV